MLKALKKLGKKINPKNAQGTGNAEPSVNTGVQHHAAAPATVIEAPRVISYAVEVPETQLQQQNPSQKHRDSVSAPQAPGLPVELLDYTHEGALEDTCDYGAGHSELEEPSEQGELRGRDEEGCEAVAEGRDPSDHDGMASLCDADHYNQDSGGLSAGEQDGSNPQQDVGTPTGDATEHSASDGMQEAACTEGPPLSDPLATMVFLTEGEEAFEDAISVLSDGLTEEQLAEELSELEEALSALEGEALYRGSPGTMSTGSQLAEKLGLVQDDGSDPSVYAKQMVKLYTNLGLKLMDSRKFDDALTMMRKAEAMVENDAMWGGAAVNPTKLKRLQAIVYNNLGCLFKRRNHPQQALQYLMKALALEEEIGHVQNSSSTHLNICAAYSSLRRYKESLSHAERAIVLLQRQLWSPSASFQEGLLQISKVISTTGDVKLLSGVNVLAIAYHNAGLEHERLGRIKEAHVCFTRASTLSLKCVGARAALTVSLQRALKAFVARHQPPRGRGAGAAPRTASSGSAQVKVRQTAIASRVGGSTLAGRPPAGARVTSSRSALAASSAKGTLHLDKGRAFGKDGRSVSSGKLSDRR